MGDCHIQWKAKVMATYLVIDNVVGYMYYITMKLKLYPEWYLQKVKEKIETSYLVADNGCWEWQKSRSSFGHGKTTLKCGSVNGKLDTFAHRVYYQLVKGFIPDSTVVHHKCENPCCINPNHLVAVSQKQNNIYSKTSITSINALKEKCDNGHDFTPENTGRYVKNNWRYCRICSRTRTNKQLRTRTLKNNSLGLNSKGLPFKRKSDILRSKAWDAKNRKLADIPSRVNGV